ncbi:MAG: M23 family metallopeptidase [Gemmatimonadaceae bacterium]
MSLLLAACGPALTPITGPTPVAPPRDDVAVVPVAPAVMADADYLRARELMVPVAGVAPGRLSDSFTAARDGGERTHNALDIMAPRGTPALAADDGRVFRVGRNRLGGLTVYLLDAAERFIYYYAHLDGYRDGLRDGMPVARGDVLGYVGTTGNAPANTPHLHFQAMRYRPDRYWEGQPVNPKPYLVVTGRAGASTNATTNDQQPHR